jgi:hypothetical protein
MIPDLREIKKYIGFAIMSLSVILLYFFYPGSDSTETTKQIEKFVESVKEVIPAKGGGSIIEEVEKTNVSPQFVMKGGSPGYELFNQDSYTFLDKLLEFFI